MKGNELKKKQEEQSIQQWWKKHKSLKQDLEAFTIEIAKGSWGPKTELMEEQSIESEFPAGKLLKVWFKIWK